MSARKSNHTTLSVATYICTALVACLTALNLLSLAHKIYTRPSTQSYTWLADDYPAYLPLNLGPAKWVMQDTVHYALVTNSSDADDAEWTSTFPPGRGFVYMGLDKRRFGLSAFHQMHCLQKLRRALTDSNENEATHVTHCLTYIRDMIYCRSDLQLEPVFAPHDIHIDAEPALDWVRERSCKNWGELYRWLGENYEEWKVWNGSKSENAKR